MYATAYTAHEDDFDTFYSIDLAIPHSICRRTVTGCMLCMRVAETVRFARRRGVIGWESSDGEGEAKECMDYSSWMVLGRSEGVVPWCTVASFLYRRREGSASQGDGSAPVDTLLFGARGRRLCLCYSHRNPNIVRNHLQKCSFRTTLHRPTLSSPITHDRVVEWSMIPPERLQSALLFPSLA